MLFEGGSYMGKLGLRVWDYIVGLLIETYGVINEKRERERERETNRERERERKHREFEV